MVKVPRAGAVKTRLVPPLTPEEAATLSVSFLRDLATNIAGLSVEDGAEGIAVYTPVGAESDLHGVLPDGFSLLPQRGESLGERLFHAAEDLQSLGFERFCFINADSPTLPRAMLTQADTALSRPGDRVVLGPAEDGGYYLIGLKRAHQRLFADVEWSTKKVLSQTVERAAEIGLEVVMLPSWYDVDDEASLRRLCEELFPSSGEHPAQAGLSGYAAPHTREYLTRLVERGRVNGFCRKRLHA